MAPPRRAGEAAGSGRAQGVYVHIPFCSKRCDYCDFTTFTDRTHLMADYVRACVADYGRRVDAGEARPATTVFLGGGTPSLLPAELVAELLGSLWIAAGAEVTVECNPDSVDHAKLAAYRAAGVTRISLGVQSMVPRVLAALGRSHDPENVHRAVGAIADLSFESWNADVIYGSPAESPADWRDTLDAVLAFAPPHVSAYALTVEPATPLGRRVAAGAEPAPDDDVQAERYELADAVFSRSGLGWYEISNWARPGHECRHNLGYWHGSEYLALGCAAHGYTDGARWWTVATPERYVERVRRGESPVAGREQLDERRRAEESFALWLRTSDGAPMPPGGETVVAELDAAGVVEVEGERIRLTRRGRLLATDVTARLLAAVPDRSQQTMPAAGTR